MILHVQKVSGISGSEAHLLSLLPGLRERGYDARFLMLHEGEPGAGEFAAALRARGIPLEELRLRGDADPVAFARLVAALRRQRPRLLHTHLFHADVYGLLAGALARVPVRASTKHGFNDFRSHALLAALDRAVFRLADLHVAISRGLARYLAELEGLPEERFEIVHYGIAAGPEPPPPPAAPSLLCIGRLVPIKGHGVLFEAFESARRELPGLTLALAGVGPLEDSLRASAPAGVTFLGRVAPVGPTLEEHTIVVVPSLGEGFGMVALEAHERGRPVIASDIGGLPEIVADGETGLVVPSGEPAPLAAAIVRLAGDPALVARLGEAARRRALSEFTEARCIDRTAELYRPLL
ncbi:MAG TPA: glycosyltransferase family 4 protein [Gaiellaceae bacterium]|nr:glycosyltransferase family 4 protein [Gaiellaceae bacterium]